jgi:hypothetical protein
MGVQQLLEVLLDKSVLGTLSVTVGLISLVPYLVDVVRGRTKPHMFSWLIWGMVMAIACAAQWAADAGPGAWWTLCSALGCLSIAALSLWQGEKNITRSDWWALVFAFLAIPLWYVTEEPLWSVILVTCIDISGYYPTFRKSYLKPYEEHATAFSIGAVGCFISICAMESFTLTTVLYPIMICSMNALLVTMLLLRRRILRTVEGI